MSGRAKTARFYVIVVAIVVLLALAQRYLSRLPYAEPEIAALTPFQEKQFGLFVDMSKLLITLATLALGGIGAFVFKRYEGKSLRSAQVFRAVAAWLLCVLSLVLWCVYKRELDLDVSERLF